MTMAKLNRSALIHWINGKPAAVSPAWYKIGKDVEDMSVDLNAEIETQKNILDETSVRHNGYEPSMSVETYYADPEDDIYEFITGIAMGRLKGDDCKTQVLEVIIEDTEASSHNAWKEDVIVEVTSYGGGQGGVAIPYTVHYAGNRESGTVSISDGQPTFSKG